MRTLRRLAAPLAVLLAAAVLGPLAYAESASAVPATGPCASGSWQITNIASQLVERQTPGLSNAIQLVTPPGDCFSHINGTTWNGLPVNEWEDLTTDACLYSGPVTNYAVVTATCQASDGYEQWNTSQQAGNCTPIACEWWVNRGVTDFRHNGNQYFMTALGNSYGSTVAVYGPGYGNEAIWYVI